MEPAAAGLYMDQSTVITCEVVKHLSFLPAMTQAITQLLERKGANDLLTHSKQVSCEVPSS